MRTGEFALEGNVFLVEGEKFAIRERKKVKGKPKFYLIRCEPFQYVSSLFLGRFFKPGGKGKASERRKHESKKL